MVRCSKVIVCCLMLLSFSLQALQNDNLNKRLTAEKQAILAGLHSELGHVRTETAVDIIGRGLTDDELYLIVEDMLKKDFAAHKELPKDKALAERVSALMRAHASFGRHQSRSLLDSIMRDAESRSVRNRAKNYKRKLDWFGTRNRVMADSEVYQSSQKLMTHRYLNLLNSPDQTMRRWGIEEMSRRGDLDEEVYSTLRRMLTEEVLNPINDTHLDVLAWMCKFLGQADRDNSRSLLESLAENENVHKKIKKYAKKMLAAR